MKKNKKGITLIELLAVIAIIAILFVLLIPQINNAIHKARETGVLTDFRSFELAFHSLFMEEEGEIEQGKIFDYLDDSLKFQRANGISKEESPFGTPYFVTWVNNDTGHVFTYDKKQNKYSLFVVKEKGSINVVLNGFSSSENDEFKMIFGDFEYIINSRDNVTITGYFGSSSNVSIPSHIHGKLVDEIGRHAFVKPEDVSVGNNFGSKIDNVTLPNTIERIENWAFQSNNLSSVELHEGITYIGDGAFSSNNLISVTLPSTLLYLGSSSFGLNSISSVINNSSFEDLYLNNYVFDLSPTITN